MEVKRVKCPSCGVVLDVRNSKNEAVKLITCPQCKASLRVRFQPQQPLEVATVFSGAQPQPQRGQNIPNSGETQLGGLRFGDTLLGKGRDSDETLLAGKGAQSIPQRTASLCFGGQQFPLREGINTIGRKAQTSQATVQVPTSDPYMSRSHVRIVLSTLQNGRLKAVITNDHNKNITTVNGVELLGDDAIILSEDARIVMGKTTVVYQER